IYAPTVDGLYLTRRSAEQPSAASTPSCKRWSTSLKYCAYLPLNRRVATRFAGYVDARAKKISCDIAGGAIDRLRASGIRCEYGQSDRFACLSESQQRGDGRHFQDRYA